MTAPAADQQPGRPVRWLLLALLALAALLPRMLDLGGFITHDEAEFWLTRSEQFLEAVQEGRFADTAITTHPGVTTMWLGSAGILLRRAMLEWGVVDAMPFPLLLGLMRLPAALVHTAAVLVGYALLRRMVPFGLALLAALLWAADPFLIGYSRLLHTDALAASFAALCLLAAAAYWHHRPHFGLLVLSAVCGGLAVLSKSPALAVLPLVALAAFWTLDDRLSALGYRLSALALWGIVFALTIAAVWPAVWADPLRVYELLRTGIEAEGAQPHMTGNFFLGQATPVPDWRYYPATLALRTTPLTLAGLLLLPLVWHRGRELLAARRSLLLLAAFVVLLVLAFTLFPKKFNRYLVLAFPAVDVLAAAGLVWAIGALARRRIYIQRVLLAGVALAAWLNAAAWHPYSIAAFNQALGGARAGAQTFSVGWGEGFGQAAAWLNEQPDITGVQTAAIMIRSLQPYLRHGAQAVTPEGPTLPPDTGYVVVYIYQAQGTVFAPFDQFYPQATPLHVVRIHGVPYVWIYQAPPMLAHPLAVDFGAALRLRGYEAAGPLRRGATTTLRLAWQAQAPLPTDYWLFAHLLNAAGERVAQVDVPLPTSEWEPPRTYLSELPLTLPADAPPGSYRLLLGLYDPASGERLPLAPAHAADPALSGPHALPLTRLEAAE
jgi:4-amino-4-deoxy-L-arabinose transferase-like glycosyltransferase